MRTSAETEAKMRQLYEQWQLSGLSKKLFCEQRDIVSGTFHYWVKKFKKGAAAAAGFTELRVDKEFTKPRIILEISYPGGTTVKVYEPVDPQWLKQIV